MVAATAILGLVSAPGAGKKQSKKAAAAPEQPLEPMTPAFLPSPPGLEPISEAFQLIGAPPGLEKMDCGNDDGSDSGFWSRSTTGGGGFDLAWSEEEQWSESATPPEGAEGFDPLAEEFARLCMVWSHNSMYHDKVAMVADLMAAQRQQEVAAAAKLAAHLAPAPPPRFQLQAQGMATSVKMFCPWCGSQRAPQHTFCTQCGTKLDE